jgi:serine/threonine protein kinase
MADLEGVMLSDYLLTQCISKGGVADVYRASVRNESCVENKSEEKFEVAVKVFRSGYAQREAFRTYFMIEAEKIGRLHHPTILPVLEYGEGENLLYLVTPFVANGTLDDLLRRVGGHFSPTQAVPILQQVCGAVQYAHNSDVLHGNIKPSNIFVTTDGRMLLTDFGIARGYDDSQQSLTRVGWGSAEYASPEQSLGVVRRGSDVYALGILLFRILTGSTPFTGQTPVEVLLKHVRQQPPSVRSFVPTISNAVDEVLQLAMRKRSDDRYASVEEFAKAFAAAVYVAPIASPLSQPIAMGNRQPAQSGAKTSQLVPPSSPALIGNPETPLPPNVTLNTSLPAATSLTREFSPPTMTTPLKEKAAAPSTTEPVERKEEPMESFLDDNTGDHKSLLWTVDPAEWSPIVREDAEDAVPHIPFTATDYVQSKPLILPSVEETKQEQKIETFNVRLKKLLPLLVVILLLIGLLGAMLSAFLYPTNKSGAYSPIYLTSHTIVVYEQ